MAVLSGQSGLLSALLHGGPQDELFPGQLAHVLEEGLQVDDSATESFSKIIDGILGGSLVGIGIE